MFQLIDITIDMIFFSINWKNNFDRSILVISMTVLGFGCPHDAQTPWWVRLYVGISHMLLWLDPDDNFKRNS